MKAEILEEDGTVCYANYVSDNSFYPNALKCVATVKIPTLFIKNAVSHICTTCSLNKLLN